MKLTCELRRVQSALWSRESPNAANPPKRCAPSLPAVLWRPADVSHRPINLIRQEREESAGWADLLQQKVVCCNSMEFQIRRSANILVATILQKKNKKFLIGHFASALGSAYVIRNGNEQWGWNCSGNETAIEIELQFMWNYVELQWWWTSMENKRMELQSKSSI